MVNLLDLSVQKYTNSTNYMKKKGLKNKPKISHAEVATKSFESQLFEVQYFK